jgi:hypothetical protein
LGGARGVAAGLLEAGLVVGGVGLTPQGHLQSSGRQDELLEMRETGKQLCASVPCQSLIVRTDEIQQKKKRALEKLSKRKHILIHNAFLLILQSCWQAAQHSTLVLSSAEHRR